MNPFHLRVKTITLPGVIRAARIASSQNSRLCPDGFFLSAERLFVTTKRIYNKAMEFEWDADKAAQNLRKHGVQFSVAARALFDPCRIEMYDRGEDYGEDR